MNSKDVVAAAFKGLRFHKTKDRNLAIDRTVSLIDSAVKAERDNQKQHREEVILRHSHDISLKNDTITTLKTELRRQQSRHFDDIVRFAQGDIDIMGVARDNRAGTDEAERAR